MEKYSIEPYEKDKEVSNFRKEEAYLRAKKKVDAIIGFYWHLAVYVVVNIFLIILIGVNSGQGFTGFGPYATNRINISFLRCFWAKFFLWKGLGKQKNR